MAGLKRFMSVLRLFTEHRDAWTVPAMAEALSTPASSIYRTVRELVAEGLLEPSAASTYRLGAAFIEFDRLTRLTDPLVKLGEPLLQELVRQAQVACVGLLCRLYDDTVMCVADAADPRATFHSSYERGRPMPLTRGATSQVILAQLPPRRLKRLWDSETEAQATPRVSFPEFQRTLTLVRRAGHAVTRGEIDQGLVGIAVPLIVPTSATIASLSLVVEGAHLHQALEQRLILLLVASASLLVGSLPRPETIEERGSGRAVPSPVPS